MWSIKRASWVPVIVAAGLAGCTAVGLDSKPDPLTPTQRYKLSVEQHPDQVALRPHVGGLSPTQKGALADFMNRWRTSGGGEIVVETPSSGADPSAISHTAADAMAELEALGAPRNALRYTAYDSAGAADAPVVARFTTLAMKKEDCSTGYDNLVSTGKNDTPSHFGCAVTSNMAMQIARPRDVIAPAQEDYADATRRENVLGLYRKGDLTAAKREEQAVVNVGNGVRQ